MVDGEAATTVKSTMVLCCCVPFCAQTVIGKVTVNVTGTVSASWVPEVLRDAPLPEILRCELLALPELVGVKPPSQFALASSARYSKLEPGSHSLVTATWVRRVRLRISQVSGLNYVRNAIIGHKQNLHPGWDSRSL